MSVGGCFRQRTEGAVALETGLLMSVLVLLIMGALQIAEVWWTYNTMLLAVGDVARYVMLYTNGPALACGLQTQAPQCPAPSDTPRANCAAARGASSFVHVPGGKCQRIRQREHRIVVAKRNHLRQLFAWHTRTTLASVPVRNPGQSNHGPINWSGGYGQYPVGNYNG